VKRLYHLFISLVLRLVGLNFSWYQTFYVRVIYALPIVEPVLQLLRTSKRAKSILGVPDALRFIKPGDVVLDFGANVGSVSSLFLSMGLSVHAYEPDSRCVALLQRRFKWISRERLHIHHAAVSNMNGTVNLHYGSITTESNSIIPDKPGADGSTGGEEVLAQGILEILDQFNYVPLIKMDIEGAEYDVLDTLLQPEHLDRFGVCLVEVHARKIPDLMPRQYELEERVAALGLKDRVLLTWH
jgi:FkbM family methyltransferase